MTPSAMASFSLRRITRFRSTTYSTCLGGRHHHAGELDLADAERAAPARRAEPAQEEAGQLPQRIEPEAARHDGIALEMAARRTSRAPDCRRPRARPRSGPCRARRRSRRCWRCGRTSAWAAAAAGRCPAPNSSPRPQVSKILVFVARAAFGHDPLRLIPSRIPANASRCRRASSTVAFPITLAGTAQKP